MNNEVKKKQLKRKEEIAKNYNKVFGEGAIEKLAEAFGVETDTVLGSVSGSFLVGDETIKSDIDFSVNQYDAIAMLVSECFSFKILDSYGSMGNERARILEAKSVGFPKINIIVWESEALKYEFRKLLRESLELGLNKEMRAKYCNFNIDARMSYLKKR